MFFVGQGNKDGDTNTINILFLYQKGKVIIGVLEGEGLLVY